MISQSTLRSLPHRTQEELRKSEDICLLMFFDFFLNIVILIIVSVRGCSY